MRAFVRRFSWLVPIGLLCLLAGCGSGGSAYVKSINAYVDQGASSNINVKIGGSVAANNLMLGTATPAYNKVGAGSNRNVQISATGGTSATFQHSLLKNGYYTIVAASSGSSLGATVLTDDLTPPSSGNVKIRFVDEALTAGPVDIYVTAPNAVIDNPKNPVQPTLSNVSPGSASAYLQIPGGTYRFFVTAAGDPSNIIIDTGSTIAPLTTGNVYTAVALDPHLGCLPGPAKCTVIAPFSLFVTQDQPVPGVTPVAPGM